MCTTDPPLLRASCLLLCLVAGSRQLSISEFIVPHVVEVGSDVALQCSYQLGFNNSEKGIFVKWWFTPPPSSGEERKQLYQRGPDHQPHSLRHKAEIELKDNDTIVLSEVKPIASGVYECEVSDIEEDRRRQELIVYSRGSGPRLNVTEVEGGPGEDQEMDVLVECTVDDAAPLPRLVITIKGEEVNVTENLSGPDELGFYDMLVNWTASKSEVDGQEIRCELFYENSNITRSPFYVTTTQYHPSGGKESTSEAPAVLPEAAVTSELLQNSPDEAYRMRSSTLLFLFIIVATVYAAFI